MTAMRPAFSAPRSMMDRKPPHGAPCNRCGLCCIASLCPAAAQVFKRPEHPGPCPALIIDSDISSCGLIVEPEKHTAVIAAVHGKAPAADAARWLVGFGTGCDARFNGEAADQAFYAKLNQWDRDFNSEVAKAKKVWRME